MARIPVAYNRERLTPSNTRPIASISPDAITAPARAMQGFGDAVNQAGQDFYATIERKRKEDERFDLANAKNIALEKQLEIQSDLEKNPNAHVQWGDAHRVRMAEIQKEVGSTLSGDAAKEFDVWFQGLSIRGQHSVEMKSHGLLVGEKRNATTAAIESSLNVAVGAESAQDRIDALNSINETITTAVNAQYLSPEEGEKLKRTARENYAKRRLTMLDPDTRAAVLSREYKPGVDPRSAAAFTALEMTWGEPLKVTSSYRSPEYNASLPNAAKNSKHIQGKAFDVSTAGWSRERQIAFIRTAREAGFSGIGIYDGHIHVDTGPLRAWGSDRSSNSIPEWAKGVLGVPVGKINAPSSSDVALPDLLDPDYVNAELEKALREIERNQVVAEKEFTAGFADVIDTMRAGVSISDDILAQYNEEAIMATVKDPERQQVLIQTLENTREVSSFMDEMSGMTDKEILQRAQEVTGSLTQEVDSAADLQIAAGQARDAAAVEKAAANTLQDRREKFEKLAEAQAEAQAEDEKAFLEAFRTYLDAVGSGAEISSVLRQQFSTSNIRQAVNDVTTQDTLIEILADTQQIRGVLEDLPDMSQEEIQRVAEELQQNTNVEDMTDAELASSRTNMASNFRKAAQSVLEARAKDPAGYVLSQDPTLADLAESDPARYAEFVLQEQELLGLASDSQRVLSNPQREAIVANIQEMPVDEVGAQLKGFRDSYGSHGPKVMAELMSDDGFAPEYVLAMRHSDTPDFVTELISVSRLEEKDLKENLSNTLIGEAETALEDGLRDFMTVFETGDYTGVGTEIVNTTSEIGRKLTLFYMRKNMSPSDAAERAVQRLVPETIISEDRLQVALPPEFNQREETNAMEALLDSRLLQKVDLVPLSIPDMIEPVEGELLVNAIAATGMWVQNDTGDGAFLTVDIDGMPLVVERRDEDGNVVPYEYKFGTPVEPYRPYLGRGLGYLD